MKRRDVLSFFGIGRATLSRWVRLYRENDGDLSPMIRGRYKTQKVSDEELLFYIEQRDDATLEEIAGHFNVSTHLIFYRFKLLGITRKKNHAL